MKITRNPMAKAMLKAMLTEAKKNEEWDSEMNGKAVVQVAIEAAHAVPDDAGEEFECTCPECGGQGEHIWWEKPSTPCPRCKGKGTLLVKEVKP